MKLSNVLRVKRSQFMKWAKNSATTSSGGSVVPFIRIKSGNYTDRRLFLLRQLIYKFKSQLKKQKLKWQARPKISYSYDMKSYSQNFDDVSLRGDKSLFV